MTYLALGFPKRYHLTGNESTVQSLRLDSSEKLLVSVHGGRVVVWDGCRKRTVLASKKICTDGDLIGADWSDDGMHIFTAKADGTVFVLDVEQGNRAEKYDLTGRNGTDTVSSAMRAMDSTSRNIVLKVKAETQIFNGSANSSQKATMLSSCPAGVLIGTSSSELIRISALCEVKWRVFLPEFLRHDNALMKMGLSDASSENANISAILSDDSDAVGGIVCIHFSKELELCGVVLGNGAAFLLAFPDGAKSGPESSQSRWLRSSGVVSVALEHRRMIATVGLRNGSVDHLHIGYTPGDACTLMKSISLSSWHFDVEETGSAAILRWSRDGNALAIAWEKRGVAVWSVSGCRMIWTLRQVGGKLSARKSHDDGKPNGVVKQRNPFAIDGRVLSLEWGPRGYFLWSAALDEHVGSPRGSILEMSLYRSGVLRNAYQSEATRTSLLGYDRVMVLGCLDETRREVLDWQQLLIPAEYILYTWPPEFIAVNDEKTHVAVAASRGVAVCTISTRRWRLFGDLSSSNRRRCCALAWFGRNLLIFNEIDLGSGSMSYELNVLTRDANASPITQPQVHIPAKPLLVDVRADGYLLIVCVDSMLYLYKMEKDRSSISVRLRAKMVLPTRESNSSRDSSKTPGGGISVARIFPPIDLLDLDADSQHQIPTKLMLVRSTGTLVLVDMANMMSIPLLRNVEQFWYSSPSPSEDFPFNSSKTRPAFWAHRDQGVQVCFAHDFKKLLKEHILHPRQRSAEDYVEKWFESDPEVYPLGVSAESGMILGVTQRVEMDVLGGVDQPVPFYTISVKGQPVLHRLLSHLLRNFDDDRLALSFAVQCHHLPQFFDALEWLLFEAVTEVDETSSGNEKLEKREFLAKVIRLLHYFGEYEDIVVRCARKMESKRWPLLFKEVGEPAALLEICYMSHRFRSASYLLVILQEMWGFMSALHHVSRLLQKAIETGCYDLASELVHFLDNAEAAATYSSSPKLRDSGQIKSKSAVSDAVLRQSRKLLDEENYRSLIFLSLFMKYPLGDLLAKQRLSRVSDFKNSAIRLHRMFVWDEPTVEMVQASIDDSEDLEIPMTPSAVKTPHGETEEERILRLLGSDAGINFHEILRAAADSPLLRKRIRARARASSSLELTYLMKSACIAGGAADDLALLTGMMLLNVTVLRDIYQRSPELGNDFVTFLKRSGSKGYTLLGDSITVETEASTKATEDT